MSTFPSLCGGYGIRGDKGETGQGVFFQGFWDSGEEYTAGDMVTTDEGIFIASVDVPAGVSPPDDLWQLLVLWSEITGPAGPTGPSGPAGATYTHTQASPSASWSVNHGLGYYPAITVINSAGHVVYADIEHTNVNSAVITFPTPTTGTASCT